MNDADLQLDWLRLSRKRDPATSRAAAKLIAPRLSALQTRVLEAIRLHPGSTAQDLEELAEFSDFAPSTVRKRVCELANKHLIRATGIRKNSRGYSMAVWCAVSQGTAS